MHNKDSLYHVLGNSGLVVTRFTMVHEIGTSKIQLVTVREFYLISCLLA